ncbi:MAG: hypothetical protein ACI8RD_009354 [Bacillariaceae sp.]|jgi:hypothetical protein
MTIQQENRKGEGEKIKGRVQQITEKSNGENTDF